VADHSISVKLRADVAEYIAGLGKAERATKGLIAQLNEQAKINTRQVTPTAASVKPLQDTAAAAASAARGLTAADRAAASFSSRFTTGMTQARSSAAGFTAELSRAAKAGKLDAVASQATHAGLALSAAFVGAVAVTAKFEQQMSKVGAVADASGAQLDQLRQAALQAGKDTAYSATQSAQAEEELAKAGMTSAEILSGGLSGALSLAAAGDLDLAEAASIAAKTMTTFNLNASQTGHVADLLAASANKSATDVHELGAALAQGGIASAAYGVSAEETVGTLSAFADNALRGSDAGTSYKQMLLQLSAPSDKAAKTMDKLGISAYDAAGNFVGIKDLAGQLHDKLGPLNQEQRNLALTTIFGSDAFRAANILYKEGAQGIADYTAKVNDTGAAADAAAKKQDNLAGDVEKLTGSLETMFITSGEGANSGLRTLVQGLNGLVDAIGAVPAPILTAVTVLGGLAGGALLLGSAWIKLRSTTADVLGELRKAGPAGEQAAAGLEKSGKAAGKAAAAFIALEAADYVLGQLADKPADVDKLTQSIEKLGKTGEVSGELDRVFGSAGSLASGLNSLNGFHGQMETLYADFQTLQNVGGSNSTTSFFEQLPLAGQAIQELEKELTGSNVTKATADFEALNKALTPLAEAGRYKDVAKFLDDMSSKTGIDYSDLLDKLPGLQQAMADGAAKTDLQAQAEQRATDNANLLAGGLEAATSQGTSLIDVWNELHGATLDADEALLKAKRAIDDVAKGFKSNGKAIKGNSEAALENRINIQNAAKSAADAAQKRFAETGSIRAATKAYDGQIASLKKVMHHAGLSDAQINTLIGDLARMPPSAYTDVRVDTGAARASLEAFMAAFHNRQIEIRAHAYIEYDNSGAPKDVRLPGAGRIPSRWGGVYTPARDGLLSAADIYSPKAPGRYMIAEPETGGEAFVPKRGDKKRSISILDTAASWYGQKVVPMARGGVTAAATGLVNYAPADTSSGGGRVGFADSYSSALDGLTALNKAIKDNGRAFGFSTEKSRENLRSVLSVIKGAQDAAKAKYDETGSVTAANAVYDKHIARLRALLGQQKINSATIRQLMSYSQRPSFAAPVNSVANVAYAKSAIGAAGSISELGDKLSLNAPTVGMGSPEGRENLGSIIDALGAAGEAAQARFAQTGSKKLASKLYGDYVKQIESALVHNGYSAATVKKLMASYGKITLTSNARGGVYMAADGLTNLRDASMFGGGSSPLYGFAEPQTGGEMFLPRLGDRQRGQDLLSIGAGWYGGRYVPNDSSGSQQPQVVNNNLTVQPRTADLSMSELQGFMRQMDAQARVGRRR